jgi:hypothetical protein
MDLTRHIEFLNQAIANQRASQRFHVSWALGVIGLGLSGIALVHLLAGRVIPDDLKWLLTLGSAFVSTLPGFPLILGTRRDKIAALIFLRQQCMHLQALGTQSDPKEVDRMEQLLWQFVGKTLGA